MTPLGVRFIAPFVVFLVVSLLQVASATPRIGRSGGSATILLVCRFQKRTAKQGVEVRGGHRNRDDCRPRTLIHVHPDQRVRGVNNTPQTHALPSCQRVFRPLNPQTLQFSLRGLLQNPLIPWQAPLPLNGLQSGAGGSPCHFQTIDYRWRSRSGGSWWMMNANSTSTRFEHSMSPKVLPNCSTLTYSHRYQTPRRGFETEF